MINKNVYENEFIQTLYNGVYCGDIKFGDLRVIFNDIIGIIKTTSYVEDNIQYMVDLTNVDDIFIKRQADLYFNTTKRNIEKYSKNDIISTIINNIDLINKEITKDIEAIINAYQCIGQEPRFINTLMSVDELKQKLNL